MTFAILLAGKNNDLVFCVLFVSRSSRHGDALEGVRFGLGLIPGADILLYDEVSSRLLFDLCLETEAEE